MSMLVQKGTFSVVIHYSPVTGRIMHVCSYYSVKACPCPVPETWAHEHTLLHACMLAIRGTIGKLNNTHVLDVGVGQPSQKLLIGTTTTYKVDGQTLAKLTVKSGPMSTSNPKSVKPVAITL